MKKLRTVLLFSLILIVLVYIICILKNEIIYTKYSVDTEKITGLITDYEVDGNKLKIEIKAKEKIIGNYYFNIENDKNSFLDNYKLGDIVTINGQLTIPNSNRNFYLFNYKKYLYSRKIYWIMNIETINKKYSNKNIFFSIKNYITQKINNNKSKIYLKLFLLGENNLNDNINNAYRGNGISHLFAISGIQISIIGILIVNVLKRITSSKLITFIVVMVSLFFFLFLTDYAPAVLRSVIVFLVLLFFKNINYKINILNILIITGIILLIYNPYYIYNLGFVFSFGISFFLIIMGKSINNIKNYLLKTLYISVIAYLVSIPILINNFFEINLLSPLINLIFVPYVTFAIFPFAVLTFIFPLLSNLFNVLTYILERLSLIIEKVDYFKLILCHIPWYIVILYYIVIIIILHFFSNRRYYFILIIVPILFLHSNINCFKQYSSITMLDVNQGDSILISLKSGENILVDTGGILSYKTEDWKSRKNKYSLAVSQIIPSLKSLGIKKIDYLILTHGDVDHIGESINLINNFKVDNVIFNVGEFNNLELELIDVLEKNEIKYYKKLEELSINNNKLYFLNTEVYDTENDNSIVIYLKLDNMKMLFMGDAGNTREKDILDKYNLTDIDILKIGHHGSSTSSSEDFIDGINPKICLISVGANNRYGHPNKIILERLKECDTYRTDLNGSIEIKLNNSNYDIKTISS